MAMQADGVVVVSNLPFAEKGKDGTHGFVSERKAGKVRYPAAT
jgi:hypothetical protein